MKVWITVSSKKMETADGDSIRVPDYPTYYQVRPKGGNVDGTFDVLVDDPNAKPQ